MQNGLEQVQAYSALMGTSKTLRSKSTRPAELWKP